MISFDAILFEVQQSPKILLVNKTIYLIEHPRDTEWSLVSKGRVIHSLIDGDVLVRAGPTGTYIQIHDSGLLEKDRVEISDEEIMKLGKVFKVILRGK